MKTEKFIVEGTVRKKEKVFRMIGIILVVFWFFTFIVDSISQDKKQGVKCALIVASDSLGINRAFLNIDGTVIQVQTFEAKVEIQNDSLKTVVPLIIAFRGDTISVYRMQSQWIDATRELTK